MADILNFPGAEPAQTSPAPQPAHDDGGMASLLKQALDLAVAGKLRAVGICWVNDRGSCAEAWAAPGPENHQLMAAINYLQVRYANAQLERGFEPTFEPDLPTVS